MKKVLLLLCCICAASTSFAQRVTAGVKGGINFATLVSSYYNDDNSVSTNALTSFSAGVFVNIRSAEDFSIQPALLYSVKGGSQVEDGTTLKAKINYLQLPVNFLYTKPTVAGEFFLGAGPFISYGLSASVQAKQGNTTYSQAINFGDGTDEYKRVDAGFDVLAGFKFKPGIMLNLSYDFGFMNVSNDTNIKTRNQVFGISLGYAFGKK